MTDINIYKDIATRTGGDIYIGVVGPVRTGKSTFIKRFLDALVLPNIDNEYDKKRTKDEMPQSAAGRTVMTTEPKFIPDEAVEVTLGGGERLRVKMIDCVGYLVPGVLGDTEGGEARMVSTPWQTEPMPFAEAAEMGTRKVINDHSTIGILVTSDGSFGELPRANFVAAEEQVVRELKQIGKPFAIILNSAEPESEEAVTLALDIESKYGAPVALVSCLTLDAEDIRQILELVLFEFPVKEVDISIPRWLGALDKNHQLVQSLTATIRECAAKAHRMGDLRGGGAFLPLRDNDAVATVAVGDIDLGCGRAEIIITVPDELYYKIIGEMTGFDIKDEEELIRLMRELAAIKREYDKVANALQMVNEKGYGIVMPDIKDLTLDEPEIVRQAGGYGVRLRAAAPSIHMIRATIETEINPIVGTEAQSEEIVRYLLREFDEDPQAIWQSNMFGKTLYELVNEGLHTKLEHMPEDAREKLSETLGRIINEGSSGLICIIL